MFNSLKKMFGRPETPVETLQSKVEHIGYAKFPFLHPEYSPTSRVPCADFTGFIVERLQSGDVHSIVTLMHEILRGNPGLGLSDGSWIDAEINTILAVDFQRYIQFRHPRAFQELTAMWIMAAKDGIARQFWISPDSKFPTFFSRALCAYDTVPQQEMLNLLRRANKWLAKMRKEAPFWENYPNFDTCALTLRPFEPGPASAKLLELPIGTRLHIFSALCFGLGSLPSLTDYKLRSFGLHIPESVRQILDSQLLLLTANADAVTRSLPRDDLARECQSLGVSTKKSWSKQRLLEAILAVKPEFLQEASVAKSIVAANSQYASELASLAGRSQDLEKLFRILCFAT